MPSDKILDKPFGLTVDVLWEIRKAMRALKRAERMIVREHRAIKKRRGGKSDEWAESQRIAALEKSLAAFEKGVEEK